MPPAGGNNEKGFWEDIDFNEINIELLELLGHDWHTLSTVTDEQFNTPAVAALKLRAVEMLRNKLLDADNFGVKDPRMARTMPFWESIFKHLNFDYKFVVANRNPANAARSLAKRDEFELEKGYLLWHEHMILSLRYSAHKPRIVVDYDNLISHPEAQLKRIAQRFDLDFLETSKQTQDFLDEFLERGLRHHSLSRADLKLDPKVPTETIRLSTLLFALSDDQIPDDEDVTDQVEQYYVTMIENKQALDLLTKFDQRNAELAKNLAHKIAEHAIKSEESKTLASQLNACSAKLNDTQFAHEQIASLLRQTEEHIAGLKQERDQLLKSNSELQAARADSLGAIEHKNHELARLEASLKEHSSVRLLLKKLIREIAKGFSPAPKMKQKRVKQRLLNSGLFDPSFYLAANPDVKTAQADPLEHYLNYGWIEGRDPSPGFANEMYLDAYADVRNSGSNPLLHYLKHGHREKRVIYNTKGYPYHFDLQKTVLEKAVSTARYAKQNPQLIVRFFEEIKRSGFSKAIQIALRKVRALDQQDLLSNNALFSRTKIDLEYGTYKVVPYYLDPYKTQGVNQKNTRSIAVHLHLFYLDMANTCAEYLANIPENFDLFISTPPSNDLDEVNAYFSSLPNIGKLVAEHTPNRGRDIAPLIAQFGARLKSYDYIAHFHTKKSPHRASLNNWFDTLMQTLCGSQAGVGQILELLDGDAKVVYPAGNLTPEWDSGWSDNLEVAKKLLANTTLNIADFPSVEFPQGTMFWAKSSAIADFLSLDLSFDNFPPEPIAPDGTIAHALERLILIFTTAHPGRNYRLESPGLTREMDCHFESQHDYSESIAHDTIKVMAYYLPQFNPNPLNDEWHGVGFTEWNKVRSAQPLFQGHYQQHIPHRDTGYYFLDTPAHLRIQAEQIKKSGVHGLIFYHYWFSGTLILQEPAQMLLANQDIDIPFCFCWANENWTRRWDGNEQEILLGQVYSPEDARGFIRYLIPFFKDSRHVKVEGRPVLYVYRPSAMEFVDEYLSIWKEECVANGLLPPYVIATMTRGATNPMDYGMDAAVERVLQDWTGGAVPNIKDTLRPYMPINGSILDYDAVADHYIKKPLQNEYMLFKSLVPTWDNTPRYGTEAFALHNFSIEKFQSWMEHLIEYTESNIPRDRRFIIVNAWNEWAEGAHLEPDSRFGYGYLNSIGRALSNYAYTEIDHIKLPPSLTISLKLSANAVKRLAREPATKQRFISALKSSTIFNLCQVKAHDMETQTALASLGEEFVFTNNITSSLELVFNDLYLFNTTCIEAMAKMAVKFEGYNICASVRNVAEYLEDFDTKHNFGIDHQKRSGMELGPFKQAGGFKVCTKAAIFKLAEPKACMGTVSTIIRFHKNGDRALLDNAIFSLLTQVGSSARPYLALQDLDENQTAQLEKELAALPWDDGCDPVLRSYASTEAEPDLRSVMLNDMLKNVPAGYTAFLDYDDVLFPNAYETLISQIMVDNKKATFGRVYSTQVEGETGRLISRDKTYDYGNTYEEFIKANHAPLHSFLLDTRIIDVASLKYFSDMKFMEDYYMTLQIFDKNNTDWASLKRGAFIGDYIHRVGATDNTLAISDAQERQKLITSEAFLLSERRIQDLRLSLAKID